VDLKGGLGNQLFQLAFALSWTGGCMQSLALNINYYHKWNEHCGPVLHLLFPGLESYYLDVSSSPKGYSRIVLDHCPGSYRSDLWSVSGDVHFSGYFQNRKYFEPSLEQIRSLFREKNIDILRQSRNQTASPESRLVGVHLRRGDYLKPNLLVRFGLVELSDLQRAVDIAVTTIARSDSGVGQVKVVWVSDDLLLPNEGISLDSRSLREARLISQDQEISLMLKDFYCLAVCDALVISNSTFGFWAGLLSPSARNVFALSQWFKDSSVLSHELAPLSFCLYENQLI